MAHVIRQIRLLVTFNLIKSNLSYRSCGHCHKLLSEKALKEHRRLYEVDGEWIESQQDDERSHTTSPLLFNSTLPLRISDACALDPQNEDECSSSLDLEERTMDFSDEDEITNLHQGEFVRP